MQVDNKLFIFPNCVINVGRGGGGYNYIMFTDLGLFCILKVKQIKIKLK